MPEFINPVEFAEKKRVIRGNLPLPRMDRLLDMVTSNLGEVTVHLSFGKQESVSAILGSVAADLSLRCQCCLGPLDWRVRSEVRLGVVSSLEEAYRLPESYEPLLVDETGNVALLDLVQDELLLAIPAVPQHVACELPRTTHGEQMESQELRRNPFEQLARLKLT